MKGWAPSATQGLETKMGYSAYLHGGGGRGAPLPHSMALPGHAPSLETMSDLAVSNANGFTLPCRDL